MKKVKYLLLFLLFLGTVFCGDVIKSEAVLVSPPPLEVTGIFQKIDEAEKPYKIVLDVNGKEASGPLSETCVYLGEKGDYIERDLFVQRYLKRVITVELIEDTGEVVLCRVGS